MGLRERSLYQREWNRQFKEKYGCSPVTAFRRRNPDANEKHRDAEKQRWYSNPELRKRHREAGRRHRERLKREVFEHYGGFACACCGEGIVNFLSIDHVNNNGAEQRRLLGDRGCGTAFYQWLKNHGFPPGYQVLCMNCNFGKRMNGGICPHKKCSV